MLCFLCAFDASCHPYLSVHILNPLSMLRFFCASDSSFICFCLFTSFILFPCLFFVCIRLLFHPYLSLHSQVLCGQLLQLGCPPSHASLCSTLRSQAHSSGAHTQKSVLQAGALSFIYMLLVHMMCSVALYCRLAFSGSIFEDFCLCTSLQ